VHLFSEASRREEIEIRDDIAVHSQLHTFEMSMEKAVDEESVGLGGRNQI
jgi:hypothetical protein